MYEYFELFNNSRIVWGITMVMLNIGSRYIIADLGKFHETLLMNEYVKKIILFCMFFVATRDFVVTFVLTIAYMLLVDGLLHEKRRFCILPKQYIEQITKTPINEGQYLEAKKIVLAYEKFKIDPESVKAPYQQYLNNIKLLNKN